MANGVYVWRDSDSLGDMCLCLGGGGPKGDMVEDLYRNVRFSKIIYVGFKEPAIGWQMYVRLANLLHI